MALADNPRPAGCKKLKGYKDQWRIRVGDYRVVYTIDDARLLVGSHGTDFVPWVCKNVPTA